MSEPDNQREWPVTGGPFPESPTQATTSTESSWRTEDTGAAPILGGAAEFIRALYPDDEDGWLVMSSNRTGSHNVAIKERLNAADLPDIVRQVDELSTQHDVWMNVCLQADRPSGRGRVDGVGVVPAVWAEVDDDKTPNGVDAVTVLRGLSMPPSLIVASGHGFHCYWLLEAPVTVSTDTERQEFTTLNRRAWRLVSDAIGQRQNFVGDLARELRPPGTINFKGEEDPRFVEVVSWTASRHTVTMLDRSLPAVEATFPNGEERTSFEHLLDVAGQTGSGAAQEALNRVAAGQSRHEVGNWLANQLCGPNDLRLPRSDGLVFMRIYQAQVENTRSGIEPYTWDEASAQLTAAFEKPRVWGGFDPIETSAIDESWSRVDLGPFLNGEYEQIAPTILRREDGAGLLYLNCLNYLHGDSTAGKSWVGEIAVAQELSAGNHAMWIDLEDPGPLTIIERLRLLGAPDGFIVERLHYHRPQEPVNGAAVDLLIAQAHEQPVTLIVIDSVGEAFSLEGINEDRDVEVAPWLRRVARRLADAGPCVVLIDHATKAGDNPLYPSGSKRKRAAVTGAHYFVVAKTPFDRTHAGSITLTCAKDRHGHYRQKDVVARIDIRPEPGRLVVDVRVPVSSPAAGEHPPEKSYIVWMHNAVAAAKEANCWLGQNELLARMEGKGSKETKIAGIKQAARVGALETQDAPRNSTQYRFSHDLGVATDTRAEA